MVSFLFVERGSLTDIFKSSGEEAELVLCSHVDVFGYVLGVSSLPQDSSIVVLKLSL